MRGPYPVGRGGSSSALTSVLLRPLLSDRAKSQDGAWSLNHFLGLQAHIDRPAYSKEMIPQIDSYLLRRNAINKEYDRRVND